MEIAENDILVMRHPYLFDGHVVVRVVKLSKTMCEVSQLSERDGWRAPARRKITGQVARNLGPIGDYSIALAVLRYVKQADADYADTLRRAEEWRTNALSRLSATKEIVK